MKTSPDSAIAASNDHAVIPSSVVSSEKLLDTSEESNTQAPAVKTSNKRDHFPFMKLAVEIRLKIYGYLLVASPSRLTRTVPRIRVSEGIVLKIDFVSNTGSRNRRKVRASKWTNGNGYPDARTGLAPQILRTCKTIYQEAVQILYSENLFSLYLIPYNRHDKLESLSRDLYLNPAGCSDYNSCNFAIFLQHIGPKNAASLKRLKFVGGGLWNLYCSLIVSWAIREITQLLKHHAPSVYQVKVCRNVIYREKLQDGSFELVYEGEEFDTGGLMTWNPEDGAEDRPRPPALVRREEQETMYKAIEEMAEEITWLKDLTVTGFEKKDPARPKVEKLQAMVKSRR